MSRKPVSMQGKSVAQVVDEQRAAAEAGKQLLTELKRSRKRSGTALPKPSLPAWLEDVNRERWKLGEETSALATPRETLIAILLDEDTTIDCYGGSSDPRCKCETPNLLVAAWRALRLEQVPAATLLELRDLRRQRAGIDQQIEHVASKLPPEARRGY